MISKIALVPDCFDKNNDPKSIISILLDIISSGILLGDFSKKDKWSVFIKELYQDQLDSKYRGRIVKLINSLQNRGKIIRLPDYNSPITTEETWFNVAIQNCKNNNLKLIVSGSKYSDSCQSEIHEKCHHINDLSIDETWVKLKKHDFILNKTPVEVGNVFKTFLPYATSLKIIDPYVNESKRWRDSIELLVKYYRAREGLGYIRDTIEIHTSKQDDDIDFRTFKVRLENMLKQIKNDAKHTIKVFVWGDNSPDDRFHDRVILTNIVGIKSAHSFDVKETSQQEVTWSILSDDSYEIHNDNFSDEEPKFKLMDAFSIVRV